MPSIIIVTDPQAQEIISIIAMLLYFSALVVFALRSYQVGQYPFTIIHWMIIAHAAVRTIDFALDIPPCITVIFTDQDPDYTLIWVSAVFDSLIRPVLYIALFLTINRWVGKIQAAKGENPRRQPRRTWSMENLMWLSMVIVSCIGLIQVLQNIFQWIILIDYTKIRNYTVLIGFSYTWFIGYLLVTIFLNLTIVLYYLRYKFIAVASQFHLLISLGLLLLPPVIFDFADAFAATSMTELDKTGDSFEAIYFFLAILPEIVIYGILSWRAEEFGTIVRLRVRNEQPLERLDA